MKYLNLFLILTIIYVCGCSSSSPLETDLPQSSPDNVIQKTQAKKNPHIVPFKATYEETWTSTLFPDYTGLELIINGTGNATHLGKSTLYVKDYVIFDSPLNEIRDGIIVFTAANGDELNAECWGWAQNPTPETVKFWGEFNITGGTGRFEDAIGSGAWDGEGISNPDGTGQGSIAFAGTLIKLIFLERR